MPLEAGLESWQQRARNPHKVNAKEQEAWQQRVRNPHKMNAKEQEARPISQGRLPWPSHFVISSELFGMVRAREVMNHFLFLSRRQVESVSHSGVFPL